MKIDLVIAYVDNSEQVWRKTFIDYCSRTRQPMRIASLNTCRYKDNICLVEYLIKLSKKNMPWIDTIYLLLSNKEQAPKDLPSNVKIVLHKDFIPSQFLPTFNSTTIEMFLWNIPTLSSYFIYTNDDMLPLHYLNPTDFFTPQGKIRVKWFAENIKENDTEFRYQCLNGYVSVCKCLNKPCDNIHYLRPEHSMTPMVKEHAKECYELLKNEINPYISAFRTIYNHNQYIYPIYEHIKYGTCECDIDFMYAKKSDEVDVDHQIVCFNIVPPEKAKVLKVELDKLCE